MKHEQGKLLCKEPLRPGQTSAAAQHVLQSGSFNSLSTASENALQMIEITVVRARNLTRQDFWGLADPYAVLQLEELCADGPPSARLADWTAGKTMQYKTKTMRNTLDPVWESSFSFVIRTDSKYNINLNVWDWDMAKSDDRMGDLTLPLTVDMLDNAERWYKLSDVRAPGYMLRKAATNASMVLHSYHQATEPDAGAAPLKRSSSSGSVGELSRRSAAGLHGNRHSVDSPTRDGSLLPPEVQIRLRLVPDAHWEVTVLQARGLPKLDVFGKADPYCVLRWGSEGDDAECIACGDGDAQREETSVHWTGKTDNERVKTSTRRNTLEPVWNDCEPARSLALLCSVCFRCAVTSLACFFWPTCLRVRAASSVT